MRKSVIILILFCFTSTNFLFSQNKFERLESAKQFNEKHNFAEAIIILEDLIGYDNENYEYFQEIAYANLNLLKFDEAIKYYQKAIELNKDCVKCYAYYSRAEYEKENLEKAEKIINEALEIDSNFPLLYMTR